MLAAAREVLTHINATLAPTRTQVSADEMSALYAALRAPQQRIVQAVHALLGSSSLPPTDTFTQDLQRILVAAAQLVPIAEGAEPAARGSGAQARPAANGGQHKALILVVDDIADNREVLRRRLEREGYATECAANGREALTMIAGGAFDLVLLDVMMPEVDGYAVLEELKAPRHPRHSGDHDLRARRHAKRGALHRARRGRLPAQAVRPGPASAPGSAPAWRRNAFVTPKRSISNRCSG